MNQEKIGKFIAEKRKEKKLTQMELAEKLRVSNRTISKWETGRCLPDYSLVNDICECLEITINELFQGKSIDEESYVKEQKEKKRKNRIKKIVKTLVILIVFYFLYKGFLLLYYGTRINSEEDEKVFPYNKNISTITVENNEMYNKMYGYNNDLKLYIPDDFELITDKAKTKMVSNEYDLYMKDYKSSEEFSAYIVVGEANNLNIHNLQNVGINSTLFPFMNVFGVFEKYNIEDEFDLYKYYEKNYNYKENIFTKISRIQMNYIAKTYSQLSLPTYEKFYYLEGDIKGIYLIAHNTHQIHFKLGDNSYYVSCTNHHKAEKDYCTEELARKIINSIDR